MERNVAPLRLKAGMVSAVIVNPEAQKNDGDKTTINNRGKNEVHGRSK
jgi:hypothetical protein